jgi:putative IMPACT (imprinted ancient) family translation regulator
MTYAETEQHKHYVSVIDGSRYGLLLGPFDYKTQAEAHVELVRREALKVDHAAWFYGFGTCRVKYRLGETPREGRLNQRLSPSVVAT